MNPDMTATAGLVVVSLAILKVLEKVYDARAASRAAKNGKDPLTVIKDILEKMVPEIHETWDIHLGPAARDDDGVLRWYTPREWVKILHSIVSTCGELKALSGRQLDLLERQDRRIEKIERSQILMLERLGPSGERRI